MTEDVISEYYLERYLLGELPDEIADEIRQRALKDPQVQAELEEMKASNHDILSLYPPSTIKANLIAQLKQTQSKPKSGGWMTRSFLFRRIIYVSSALATALVVLILLMPGLKQETGLEPEEPAGDFSQIKGIQNIDLSITQLLIFRKKKDEVEILRNGEQANTGDLLQLAYVAVKEQYGTILSIDGRGSVTLHFPEEATSATDLVLNKKSLLPNAIELDDAPGFERFLFITSEFPIDVNEVLIMADRLAENPARLEKGKLDLPEGLKQYSILILKGEGS